MSTYTDASLIYYPSGVKAGKAYSLKPTDGSGDLTFTRASTATRVNSAGLIESVATGVPRIDYTSGCGKLLLEPQRTNLVFPSATASTQTVITTAQSYTLSFYGTGTVVRSGTSTGTLVGTGANDRVFVTFTATAGSLTLTITGSVTDWQLEAGAYSTSVIITTTTAVTRVADAFTRDNIYTNGLITASGGTWFADLRGNLSYTATGFLRLGVGDTDTLSTNSLILRTTGTSRIIISKIVGGSASTLYNTLTDSVKIAIKWNGTSADVFVNGVKEVSAASFTTTNMNFFNGGINSPILIQSTMLFPTAKSDAELIALTTI